MKRVSRMLLCAVIAVATAAQCVACKNGDSAKKEKAEFYVWSTYATAKVGRDASLNDNFTATDGKIDVSMMKNETEGGQIIITAKTAIKSFSLTAATLESADGKIFPTENIDVYQQRYIRVNQKSDFNDVYAIGEYVPDMLLPMETAVRYKENRVKAGDNQGIYVEFDSEGVEAGEYGGSFTLDVDGVKTAVPVNVTVWDIEFTCRRSFQSAFVLYQSSLLRSEYDNSDEIVNNYIDFFLDYKVDTCLHNKKRNDFSAYGEEWLESVVRTKDNLSYNSVYIPYQFSPFYVAYSGGNITADARECAEYVVGLAKISDPENRYIDYAYFYPFELDEADVDTQYGRAANAERILAEGGEYDQTLAYAADEFRNDGYAELSEKYGADFANDVLAAIKNIPVLFTNVTYMEDWVNDYSATFCPYLSVFSEGRIAEHYASAAAEKNNGVWTYTCVGPTYPYPTFHLDDYNLGTRVSGWMEKYYGISGYLYWATTDDFFHEEWYKYLDPYTDATRWKGADGDGYLVYPGKYYGSKKPFPSLRLVAYRDSMDDYDMLSVYESLLTKYYEKYNLGALNFNDYIEDLYFALFNGAIYYNDDSLLYAAREELARRILALKNDDEIFLSETYENGGNVVNVYAETASLTIGGERVDGVKISENAYKFSVEVSKTATSVKIVGENGEVTFPLQRSVAVSALRENVSVSDGSDATSDGKIVRATLRSKLFGSIDDIRTMNFTPNAAFSLGSVAEAKNVCAKVENFTDSAVEVYVKVVIDGIVYELGSTYLRAGEKKTVRFNLINGATLDGGGSLQFYVRNVFRSETGEWELSKDVTLAISDIRVEYARGE